MHHRPSLRSIAVTLVWALVVCEFFVLNFNLIELPKPRSVKQVFEFKKGSITSGSTVYRHSLFALEPGRLNSPAEASHPTRDSICVIARTFHGHSPQTLLALVTSLVHAAQLAKADLAVIFVDTDPFVKFDRLESLIVDMNIIFGNNVVKLSPRNHPNTKILYPDFLDNDYGFIVTDHVLEDVIEDFETNGSCTYTLITNGDNLYSKYFLNATLHRIRNERQDIVRFLLFPYIAWLLFPVF